jgi:hypothetical protein
MTTPLRQKMMEDLQLHGLSGRTQALYVLAVQQLAEHYHKSPDQITEAELHAYFLYLLNEKRVTPSLPDGAPVLRAGIGPARRDRRCVYQHQRPLLYICLRQLGQQLHSAAAPIAEPHCQGG